MQSTRGPQPTEDTADNRWLWAVRIGALTMVVLFFAFLAYVVRVEKLTKQKGEFDEAGVLLIMFSPVWVTFLAIALRLHGKTIKRSLALVVGLGSPVAVVLIVLGLIGVLFARFSAGSIVIAPLPALLQVAWVASAVKSYYTMPREAGDRRTLVLGIVKGIALLFAGPLLFVTTPLGGFFPRR